MNPPPPNGTIQGWIYFHILCRHACSKKSSGVGMNSSMIFLSWQMLILWPTFMSDRFMGCQWLRAIKPHPFFGHKWAFSPPLTLDLTTRWCLFYLATQGTFTWHMGPKPYWIHVALKITPLLTMQTSSPPTAPVCLSLSLSSRPPDILCSPHEGHRVWLQSVGVGAGV